MAEVSDKAARFDEAVTTCRQRTAALGDRLQELALNLQCIVRREREADAPCIDPLDKRLRKIELEKSRILTEHSRMMAVRVMEMLESAWQELLAELEMADLLAACPDSE